MSSVAIIGGGVVGMSCALRLAHAGHEVILLDPGDRKAPASWGNAGHIATEQAAPLASLQMLKSVVPRLFLFGGPIALPPAMIRHWAPFALKLIAAARRSRFQQGQRALEALLGEAGPAWERLAADLGDPSLLRLDGHFVAWGSERTAEAGKMSWGEAPTGTTSFRNVTAKELEDLRRHWPDVHGAVRFQGSGQITDLDDLGAALERRLKSMGVRIEPRKGSIEVGTDGDAKVPGVNSDLVIIAAGIGSKALMRAAGHRVPLIAERGYHVRTRDFDWSEELPPLVLEDQSLIVTRYRHVVQVSSFVEFAAADAPPDPRKWKRLEKRVAELKLPLTPPFERWMGSRPTLPDYLPAIGRSRRHENLIYAFGHQHLGLTLASVTAELVEALAGGRTPMIDMAPFDIERFSPESS